ncbi:hypothetical protein VTO42DRAFT_8455 [Malbranchea cinnamomea]
MDIRPGDISQHYNLPNPYPEEWPADLDSSDESEDDHFSSEDPLSRRQSKTRYSALLRRGSRSLIPGSQRTGDGKDNMVQKDEPDPLGTSDSVVKILTQRGLPVDEDPRVRNRFLLSSTTFSPALFLSQTHSSASAQSLLEGLDYLSKSIDQKSASLKVLVESNFERFVRAKATIDAVYTEMKSQGLPPTSGTQQPRSHNASRSRSNLRNSTVELPNSVDSGAQKNALIRETEYGVREIRIPLTDAAVKAEEVWGAALGGRQREEGLKAVLDAVDKQRSIYELGAELMRSIKQRNYEAIAENYNRARRYANETKALADRTISNQKALTDEQIRTIVLTARMWIDVEKQIQSLKRDLWRRLSNAQSPTSTTAGRPVDEYMELISTLLELGVDDNPVWVWLLSRYDFLKTKISTFCERSRVEIEILRRRLANGEKPAPKTTVKYLQIPIRDGILNSPDRLDTEPVIELWECVHTYLKKLVSVQGGLLGDVVEFWDIIQSFVDGSRQKLLPAGFDGESRKHHRLSTNGISDLKDGVVELINLIRESVFSLFAEPPKEDISLLTSPTSPSTPGTPLTGLTPTESRFKFDLRELPPPSPKTGEPWEDFAFWPPYANSLSGVNYLSRFLILIGTAASEMSALSLISSGTSTYDKLKLLVSVARERSVRAVCAAWNKDAEVCKYLEDWRRDPTWKDLTSMPGHFIAYESAVLSGMQKILYISEAMTKPGAEDVVTPPPAKLLQMVRTQFVSSIYKALSGLVENAEHPVNVEDMDEWVRVVPTVGLHGAGPSLHGGVDPRNRNVRILLTLSNVRMLRADQVTQLVTNFESSFAVKLTDESKTIRDVLNQIDTKLFQAYIKPIADNLKSTIIKGITSPDWVPSTSRPTQVRPYVYHTMLILVMVHTEVTTTLPSSPTSQSSSSSSSSSASVTHAILSELLTQISGALLEAFMLRPMYTLPALMQATLDTEFIAQTMSQYVSDAASKIQNQIYVELDQRTNNDARAKLQAELGEMRGVLKRLRESTRGEFACFRKPRSGTSK